MGVSIDAIIEPVLAYTDEEYAALPDDESRDAAADTLYRVRNILAFAERADGRPEGWYTAVGVMRGPSSSYSGYGYFREQIAIRALGVEPEAVWSDEGGQYKGKPFYEIIDFADNEGAIGPVTCAKLAKDFREHREAFLDSEWLTEYDQMTACLEAAAEGAGFVLYR